MFEIKAIQAEHGDCLLVSYGDASDIHHILIDGGPAGTESTLLKVLDETRAGGELCLEALVITHYDLDHIEGIIELLKAKPAWLDIKDIWFNGQRHLRAKDVLGPSEGDALTDLLDKDYPWNNAFDNQAAKVRPGQKISLSGGLKIWVLSPTDKELFKLAADWGPEEPRHSGAGDVLGKKDTWPPGDYTNLANTKFRSDGSVPNASSIALMIEYNDRRALLAGDAFAQVIKESLPLHFKPGTSVHLFKLSHHGSQGNTDDKLLKALSCSRYLISTSGKTHKHPDNVLIARLLAHGGAKEIIFNYDQPQTTNWRTTPNGWPRFTATYPAPGELYVKVNMEAFPI